MTRSVVVTRLLSLSLLGLLLLACPEKKVAPPVVEPPAAALSEAELCRVFESQAQFSDICVQAPLKTGLSLDEATLAKSCRPGTDGRVWARDLLDSLRAERVVIDWTLARQCLDESRALRSGGPGYLLVQSKAFDDLRKGACTQFIQGNVADGSTCVQDWDCAEGSTCQSITPFVSGGAVCLKPGVTGDPCGDYRSCGDDYYCDLGRCKDKIADSGACDPNLYGGDCLSGSCSDSGSCDPSPAPLKGFDEACASDDECGVSCGNCRPETAGGPKACRVLGAQGAYCRDWNDCLNDLGCVDGACGTVGLGASCGSLSQAVCDPGLSCYPTVNCALYNGNQSDCEAHADTCSYASDSEECSAVEGECMDPGSLPTSGDCLYGMLCGEGSYCNASASCQTPASAGQACSDDGATAPLCNSGLACVDGGCVETCEVNEDCGEGAFCGSEGLCAALAPFACTSSEQCPAENYCVLDQDLCAGQEPSTCDKVAGCTLSDLALCNFASQCSDHDGDGAACQAAAGCRFDPSDSSCSIACYAFDSDATACNGNVGCTYDDLQGYCDPICASLGDDPATCNAAPGCVFERSQVCERQSELTGRCEAQLEVGAICQDSESCLSGDCATDDNGDQRCAVELPGCDRDIGFVREAFLFGMVFVLGRGRVRRRRS